MRYEMGGKKGRKKRNENKLPIQIGYLNPPLLPRQGRIRADQSRDCQRRRFYIRHENVSTSASNVSLKPAGSEDSRQLTPSTHSDDRKTKDSGGIWLGLQQDWRDWGEKTTEKKGKTEGRRFKETQRLEGGEIGEGLPKADFFCWNLWIFFLERFWLGRKVKKGD